MPYGTTAHRLRVPVDLDLQLLSDQASRQVTPTALRNNSEAGRFFEGLMPSPIRDYADPQTTMLGLLAHNPVSAETAVGIHSPSIATGAIAVKVGR